MDDVCCWPSFHPEGSSSSLHGTLHGLIEHPPEHCNFFEDPIFLTNYNNCVSTVDDDTVSSRGSCFGHLRSGVSRDQRRDDNFHAFVVIEEVVAHHEVEKPP